MEWSGIMAFGQDKMPINRKTSKQHSNRELSWGVWALQLEARLEKN